MSETQSISSNSSSSSSSSSNGRRALAAVRGSVNLEVAMEDREGGFKHTQQIHDSGPLEVLRLEDKDNKATSSSSSSSSLSSSLSTSSSSSSSSSSLSTSTSSHPYTLSSSNPSKLDLILNNRAATIGSLNHLKERLTNLREAADPKKHKALR